MYKEQFSWVRLIETDNDVPNSFNYITENRILNETWEENKILKKRFNFIFLPIIPKLSSQSIPKNTISGDRSNRETISYPYHKIISKFLTIYNC